MSKFGRTGRSWNRYWPHWLVILAVTMMYYTAWAQSLKMLSPRSNSIVQALSEKTGLSITSSFYLILDLSCTGFIYCFSLIFNNSSCYDPYWSILPVLILGHQLADKVDQLTGRDYVIAAVVLIWGARLTYNWLRSFKTWSHQDWRYTHLRDSNIGWMSHGFGLVTYWVVFSGLGFHIYPTLSVFGGLLPGIYAIEDSEAQKLNVLDIVGASISLAGVVLQGTADNQLYTFRKSVNFKPGSILKTGLWGRVRHPNYLGEMLFWIGLAVIGFAGTNNPYLFAGAAQMVILITCYSAPAMDKKMLDSRGKSYKVYAAKTPSFIPRLF